LACSKENKKGKILYKILQQEKKNGEYIPSENHFSAYNMMWREYICWRIIKKERKYRREKKK